VIPAACAMAVMGKASAPGRTKTRLVPPLGAEAAAQLNTAFLQDTIHNLIAAGREIDIAPYVAFGPAGSEHFFRECLPDSIGLIECCLPNFGDCLHLALGTLLARGHAAACVVNADSPTLPMQYLADAARALCAAPQRIVLGPSTDGGYYLLGVTQAHRRLFEDIEWSSARVFEQTLQRAAELDLAVTLLEPWYDVDDAAGLRQLRADLARVDTGAQYTRGVLERLAKPATADAAAAAAAAAAVALAGSGP